MRIGIDASSLLLRSAGVKNYTYYWLRALWSQARGHRIEAFPFLNRPGPLNHEGSVLGPLETIPRLALLAFGNLPGSPAFDWLAPRVDVFHASNMVRRPPRSARLTATVHDLTYLLLPDLHTAGNVRADRAYVENVLKRAHGLIAVSENTRKDCVRLLGIPAERIEVIYPGVAEEFFTTTPDAGAVMSRKYGLSGGYILYVGTVEPRKNLDRLLDAYEQMASSVRDQFQLVVIGAAGWGSDGTMARLRSQAAGVRYLGYVPEADLPALTAGAALCAYPSLYEGFGFPVAQAMAAGVPVVASNVSSLPEVACGAAELIDPRSVGELSAALQTLLLSPGRRSELAARGKQQAAKYRWEECARRSIGFFERVG